MRSAGQLFLLLMSAPSGRESHQPSIKDLMDAWMDKRNCIHIGLRRLKRHSHSMVPLGFGVRSKRTRFTPFTSEVIRAVISCSRGKGTSSTVAVMASTVLTARRITGQSKVLALSRTPVDLKSGTTVNYCQTLPSSPCLANSSRRIASDSRTASSRSRVMAPRQRTPRPGPGKG